ncbi:hypothetical protein JOC54_001089 [Alkalihalobacillus xiaoxiensis]|uniref:DUF3006 domain-containing protein n=1 Tax=Shouchella xiaoxiensis TaxID=766895 RepID=A0ABS2SQS6_9BACI|nr:DUF3006 domain-containing protein [Shouchella xiaoxiensis]MBM7837858.1 hypothetical protein [Shouchella xiaoxiensis]
MEQNRGFIDRIEAGKAVVLSGKEEKETIYELDQIYKGAKEGDYIQIEGEKLVFDQEETHKRKETIATKMKKLNRKKR